MIPISKTELTAGVFEDVETLVPLADEPDAAPDELNVHATEQVERIKGTMIAGAACGTLKGAQRHMHANDPVCPKCLGYLGLLIADVLSSTQHGTEAGYHRHIRDARRRREWDRVWSPEDGVLTQRYYKQGERDEYSGWIPAFLWPPISECPHQPTCQEAHAAVMRDRKIDEDANRADIIERGRSVKSAAKRPPGLCRPGEVPQVDSVMRKEWRRFYKRCPEAKIAIEEIAECLVGVAASKSTLTIDGKSFHLPVPPASEAITAGLSTLDELVGGLPKTTLPLRAIMAHRAVEIGAIDFNGKSWIQTQLTEDSSDDDIGDMFG